jgi:alpha-beta hydrolase superfamily lysophospholipase
VRSSNVLPVPPGWVEDEVAVPTVLGTVYGTFTHPRRSSTMVPASLIIGGSGPTDRDGNSAADPATFDTLKAVARWLAADGVASLRTDKPGSGKTGAGNLTPATAAAVTVDKYLTMNAQAFAFLGAQPGVQADRLSIVGHSEGGLFALLLASGQHGSAADVPVVHAIAALAPQSLPVLDIVSAQVTRQVEQAQAAGGATKQQADVVLQRLDEAIDAVRSGSSLPPDLPPQLASLFAPATLTYWRTADTLDPRTIARSLPPAMPMLLSCSEADIQVSCADVEQLANAATATNHDVVLTHLTDVAHTLKVDPSHSPANYGANLPFSPQLQQALATWAVK